MNDILLFPLCLAGFAAFYLAINLLLDLLSGWRKLSRSYRGRLPHVVRSQSATLNMRGVLMGGVTFTVGPYGVGLMQLPWYGVSGSLALPWQAIAWGRRYRLFGILDRFTFQVGDIDVTTSGAAAQLLDDAWRAWALPAGVALLVEPPAERTVESPVKSPVELPVEREA